MAGEPKGKKRKSRDSSASSREKVRGRNQLDVFVTPISGCEPPETTKFHGYVRNGKKRVVSLIGTTEKVRYEATNASNTQSAPNYCLAVVDKDGKVKRLHPATFLGSFERSVLALQNNDALIKKQRGSINGAIMQQRANLGLAFGTRKSQKAIMDETANRVKAETLGDIKSQLISNVEKATAALPSQAELDAKQASDRPIPPVNMAAETVEEAYNLYDIIGKEELAAINVKPMLDSQDEQAWLQKLPTRHSSFVNKRFSRIVSLEEKDFQRAKLVYVVALLQAFVSARRSVNDRETLRKKLGFPPEIVIDGLLKRFTERNGTGALQVSTKGVDKIMCYMFLLCLMLDNYSTDVTTLANDLSIKNMKANELFKTLGCRIMAYTETQWKAMGITKTEARSRKRAVLKVPLEFPRPRRGRARN
ncbi:DNA-directed RNA polymerase I complex subunit Rpa49 [Schizosaccharomyces japonicus yFS275]|uniref:DNA-directed RNA polymerase I complex subunit Rpa49 n=1 Tax=Schizosaccharomyces japonicus (strain yFS275 / FY16936) TaxID=402676 RepID=B6K5I2_SCHJY|nr:DNA-directed RNA polymerase I complex subunit Rpa49 [Schizosaccharomyces japonicus yFS275]EEB08786.1 DNA-directed RNA polymerase I complex subunit Rpa49 [Schizosaccharomyces japonicus yFS275]